MLAFASGATFPNFTPEERRKARITTQAALANKNVTPMPKADQPSPENFF